jgi:predicted N-acyltransferase
MAHGAGTPSLRHSLDTVATLADPASWEAALDAVPGALLVHTPRYSRAFQEFGDGQAECFIYRDAGGTVLYPYLVRAIPGTDWHDIATPYGYGGPVVNAASPAERAAVAARFRSVFTEYARARRIVSEFVRFHPALANQAAFDGLLTRIDIHCSNAFVDLTWSAEALFRNYRRMYRNYIRRAEELGLSLEIAITAENTRDFYDMYHRNMERKNQQGYFNFPGSFLAILEKYLHRDLALVIVRKDGRPLSAAYFLRSAPLLDYFLQASHYDGLRHRPNHYLIHRAIEWGKGEGFRLMQLGGGHETLQFFKSGFATHRQDYAIGRHIFDATAYAGLSTDHWRRHGAEWHPDASFFPSYRMRFE